MSQIFGVNLIYNCIDIVLQLSFLMMLLMWFWGRVKYSRLTILVLERLSTVSDPNLKYISYIQYKLYELLIRNRLKSSFAFIVFPIHIHENINLEKVDREWELLLAHILISINGNTNSRMLGWDRTLTFILFWPESVNLQIKEKYFKKSVVTGSKIMQHLKKL